MFEIIVSQGVSLRFTNTSSLEGLYLVTNQDAEINVSALRPAGHQRFTAAHELGHHIHGHGARIDDQFESLRSDSREEVVANSFAWHLLMPKRAVLHGFAGLGVDPSDPTAEAVYSVAAWLGVGYSTLLNHMRWTLGLITNGALHKLQKIVPQQIKRSLQPSQMWSGRRELWPLADFWANSRIHIQIGDVVTGEISQSALLRSAGEQVHVEMGNNLRASRAGLRKNSEIFCGISPQSLTTRVCL